MVKGCPLVVSCSLAAFPGKGRCSACTGLCGGGSTSACTQTLSWRVCACCQHPAAAWRGWQSPAQLPEGAWGMWASARPQITGCLQRVGWPVKGSVQQWPLCPDGSSWGAWRVGTLCQGKASCCGIHLVRVCVCVWNSHSWTFVPIGGEGNRMTLFPVCAVCVCLAVLCGQPRV